MEEPRQFERRLQRLQQTLIIYRLGLIAAMVVIVVLVLLLFAKTPPYGRAILIDGTPVTMVRDAKAAAAVRARLLSAAGGAGKATIKEKWEDAPRPTEGAEVVSVGEAVKLLKPRVTVLCVAFSIETQGVRLAVVSSREVAQRVLDQLKARYASPSDAVVRSISLYPNPAIRPCTALPADILTDEAEVVARLSAARGAPRPYTVQRGDTADSIAAQNGMTLASLWRLNPALRGHNLSVGQSVNVLGRPGLTVVTVKETVSTQIIPPPVMRETSSSVPRGQKKVIDPGKPGARRVRWAVTMHDDREIARRPLNEEVTAEPQPGKVLIGTGPTGH